VLDSGAVFFLTAQHGNLALEARRPSCAVNGGTIIHLSIRMAHCASLAFVAPIYCIRDPLRPCRRKGWYDQRQQAQACPAEGQPCLRSCEERATAQVLNAKQHFDPAWRMQVRSDASLIKCVVDAGKQIVDEMSRRKKANELSLPALGWQGKRELALPAPSRKGLACTCFLHLAFLSIAPREARG
jgi:hypothetical protein